MADVQRLSHTSAMILQAIGTGYIYGYSVMEVTGLPSGTVYPALRRLERDQLIRSQWERQSMADAEQRPPRKYYRLTRAGEKTLEASRSAIRCWQKWLRQRRLRTHERGASEWLQGAILRAASLLAPSDQRHEWIKEWRSELWYVVHGGSNAVLHGRFP